MASKLAAVIITGPETHHLKTPRALLPFGDETVLERTLRTYVDSGFEEIILVLGDRAEEIQQSVGALSEKIKVEVCPEEAQSSGDQLRRGVEAMSASVQGFALGLVDQPLLDVELVQDLVDRFSNTKKKILVPVCQRMVGQPTFFHASLAAEFKKLGPEGEAWDIIKSHGEDLEDCHLYQTAVIRRIDDLEDYHELLRIAGLPVPELPAEDTAETAEQQELAPSTPNSNGNGSPQTVGEAQLSPDPIE